MDKRQELVINTLFNRTPSNPSKYAPLDEVLCVLLTHPSPPLVVLQCCKAWKRRDFVQQALIATALAVPRSRYAREFMGEITRCIRHEQPTVEFVQGALAALFRIPVAYVLTDEFTTEEYEAMLVGLRQLLLGLMFEPFEGSGAVGIPWDLGSTLAEPLKKFLLDQPYDTARYRMFGETLIMAAERLLKGQNPTEFGKALFQEISGKFWGGLNEQQRAKLLATPTV